MHILGGTYVLVVHGIGEVLSVGVRSFLHLLIHGVHTALEWQLAVRATIATMAIPVSQSLFFLLFLLTTRRGAAGGRATAPHFTLLCQGDEICTLRTWGGLVLLCNNGNNYELDKIGAELRAYFTLVCLFA
jgi:hypothetical protein